MFCITRAWWSTMHDNAIWHAYGGVLGVWACSCWVLCGINHLLLSRWFLPGPIFVHVPSTKCQVQALHDAAAAPVPTVWVTDSHCVNHSTYACAMRHQASPRVFKVYDKSSVLLKYIIIRSWLLLYLVPSPNQANLEIAKKSSHILHPVSKIAIWYNIMQLYHTWCNYVKQLFLQPWWWTVWKAALMPWSPWNSMQNKFWLSFSSIPKVAPYRWLIAVSRPHFYCASVPALCSLCRLYVCMNQAWIKPGSVVN